MSPRGDKVLRGFRLGSTGVPPPTHLSAGSPRPGVFRDRSGTPVRLLGCHRPVCPGSTTFPRRRGDKTKGPRLGHTPERRYRHTPTEVPGRGVRDIQVRPGGRRLAGTLSTVTPVEEGRVSDVEHPFTGSRRVVGGTYVDGRVQGTLASGPGTSGVRPEERGPPRRFRCAHRPFPSVSCLPYFVYSGPTPGRSRVSSPPWCRRGTVSGPLIVGSGTVTVTTPRSRPTPERYSTLNDSFVSTAEPLTDYS